MKRVLLDENLDKRLENYFSAELDVTSVPGLGWQSKKNGELLAAMEARGITYLVTADRNIQFQQNLDKYAVVLIVVATQVIRLASLVSDVSKIETAIIDAEPNEKVILVDLRKYHDL